MSAVAVPPDITPVDRLSLTLCLALVIHAVIILGVTFAPEDLMKPRYDTMEITLVQQKSRENPDDTQLLAQASLQGGGESSDKVPIRSTLTSTLFLAAHSLIIAV